jgi:hypothetical protein
MSRDITMTSTVRFEDGQRLRFEFDGPDSKVFDEKDRPINAATLPEYKMVRFAEERGYYMRYREAAQRGRIV